MAPKPKVKFTSKFPEATKGMEDAVVAAVTKATRAGRETAAARLSKSVYNLDPGIVHERHFEGGREGGMVFIHSDHWYYRFFETGTVYIPARPFMRPANRVMRKVFLQEMEPHGVEKFVSRRTRLGGRGSVTRNVIGRA